MNRRELLTGAAALGAYHTLSGRAEALSLSESLTLLGTVGASSFAPSPAPAGYHWEFLTETGQNLTEGQPLVELVRN